MLLNVVCFFSLGVCGWIVSLCSGCVGCCAFCLMVSCVHPVAILRAVFCTICSLSMFFSDALGDHMVDTSSLQLHPHTHHIVTPGFADIPRRSDCTAGQMDREASWWTTSGNIGLPPH